jgi:hypothetical protein
MALFGNGGYGAMLEVGVEKYFRDAAVYLHMDATVDVSNFKIAKALFPATAGTYAGPELRSKSFLFRTDPAPSPPAPHPHRRHDSRTGAPWHACWARSTWSGHHPGSHILLSQY